MGTDDWSLGEELLDVGKALLVYLNSFWVLAGGSSFGDDTHAVSTSKGILVIVI